MAVMIIALPRADSEIGWKLLVRKLLVVHFLDSSIGRKSSRVWKSLVRIEGESVDNSISSWLISCILLEV